MFLITSTAGLRAAKGEHATEHVARDVAGQIARVEGAASDVGGLAELVAAREGEAVGYGQGDGDGCRLC